MIQRKKLVSGCAGLLMLTYGSVAWADFTGGYVGGSLGLFTSSLVEISDPDFSETYGIEDMFTKFDVLAGFGMQQDRAYFGVEGQYTLANNLDGTILSGPGGSLDAAAEDGWALSVRIGFLPQNDVLLYGKVAYAERTFELDAGGVSDDEVSDDNDSGRSTPTILAGCH